MKYLFEWEILGVKYGVEDFEDGQPMKDHFFGRKYNSGKDPRYMCWVGGCGIGKNDTLIGAKCRIYTHAKKHLEEQKTESILKLTQAQLAVDRLDVPLSLNKFLIKED